LLETQVIGKTDVFCCLFLGRAGKTAQDHTGVWLRNFHRNGMLPMIQATSVTSAARYFTRHEFGLIKQAFPLAMAKTCIIPPIWLIYGVNTC